MNLFVISSLGQLYQVQNIILNYEKSPARLLLIDYSKGRNRKVRSIINEHLISDLFESVEVLSIPDWMKLTNLIFLQKNVNRIRAAYAAHVDRADSIFVSNIDFHYVFLCDEVHRQKKELVLYEEGFNSYRFLAPGYFVNSRSPFRRGLKKFLGHLLLRTEADRDFYLRKNEVYYKKFDRAYLAFPEKLEPFLDIGKSESYELGYYFNDKMKDRYSRISVPKADVLLLSQDYERYLTDESFVRVVVGYLVKNFRDVKILMKPHPRDFASRCDIFDRQAKEAGLNFSILPADEKNTLPAETIFKLVDPEYLIAIDSSALLYAKFFIPGAKIISLINNFLELGDIFPRNRKILESFDFIECPEAD